MLNKIKYYLRSFLFLFLLASVVFGARGYKNYLMVGTAERSLANIVIHPRLSHEEWGGLLGSRKNQSYQLQKGDNLWRVSQKVFGDPYLWRKLWQVNDDIANPHEVEVGRLLAYYRENDGSAVPMVKLIPPKKGAVTDLDNDVLVHQSLVSRIRIFHFMAKPEEILGEVAGAYDAKSILCLADDVYVSLSGSNKLQKGDVISFAREEALEKNKHIPRFEAEGTLVRLLGQGRVVEGGEGKPRIEITECFDGIRRGDKVISLQKTVTRTVAKAPPNDLMAQILSGEETGRKNFSQGQLVVLNKGVDEGMQEGFLFRVYQDTDPNTKTRDSVEPYYKGEVQVVYAGHGNSVGYILRNTEELIPGDVLIAPQHFAARPKKVYRENLQIEIDE